MSTLFTKIVRGEIPAYKVAENSKFLAFLDIRPNAKGHVLCIPKKEIDKIWDLEAEMYQELMRFTRCVAIALEKTVSCKRVGMAVVGLEVPHTHVHLIPLNEMGDMDFSNNVEMSDEEFKELAASIGSKVDL
ncbi:HIT family protein [Gramella jeungdoensis]|uniref:HIT family protein n=1 Tax=Gramella jeungdoensis TaxID=708091 RepID=A0ABT0Z117_9FLAO|nr:HIT family protein [Gramella jeungdoensis]MCM8569405.1 HIT family protein [Gramella jeungdoensis]